MSKIGLTTRRRWIGALAVIGSGVIVPQFVDACDGRLVNLTYYIDPCGTFLANCAPGSFAANNSQLGNPCIDPECTVPGGCGTGNPPLGTVRPLCP
jgi:hypothetical protein